MTVPTAEEALRRELDAVKAESDRLRSKEDQHADTVKRLNDRYAHVVGLHKPRTDGTPPTDAEIASAIRATEYKYFGDYEMSEDQRDAVEVLVRAAQQFAAARAAIAQGEDTTHDR